MQVIRLTTYPVKSMGGEDVARAGVTFQGLSGDRRWVVLDPEGNQVTARECHALLGFLATGTAVGIYVSARDGAVRHVRTPGPDAPRAATRMSRIDELALATDEDHEWLTDRLGRPVRLAHQHDLGAREIGEGHGGRPGETMNLADAGPVLVVTEASVRRLAEWVVETQQDHWLDPADAARRFRPNILVDGDEPFAEDGWERVRIGEVTYRRGELCDRCVMTTIDLDTLETTREPVRTLARHRRWDGATWFGVRLIPESPGHIAVGDAVVLG